MTSNGFARLRPHAPPADPPHLFALLRRCFAPASLRSVLHGPVHLPRPPVVVADGVKLVEDRAHLRLLFIAQALEFFLAEPIDGLAAAVVHGALRFR